MIRLVVKHSQQMCLLFKKERQQRLQLHESGEKVWSRNKISEDCHNIFKCRGSDSFPNTKDRRKTRLIASNAICRSLKKFTCKGTLRHAFICVTSPPLLSFCLGEVYQFVDSESGQKQSVKLLQKMVSNTTQRPSTRAQQHTLYTILWLWEGGRWTREKG